MKSKRCKRYTAIGVNELFRLGIKICEKQGITNLSQLAMIQDVDRKTYLSQARRYPTQERNYTRLKAILESNIITKMKTGEISKNKGALMLWNHNRN